MRSALSIEPVTAPASRASRRGVSRRAFLALAAGAACSSAPESAPEAAAEAPPAPGFVPTDFEVPHEYAGDGYILRPLGPDLTEIDYKAYMSSIEHLQKTFSYSARWPRADLTLEDAKKDMEGEKASFDGRKSFAYAVLTPDGAVERGCFYLRPSKKEGFDAVARMWVTAEEFAAGFEPKLEADMRAWVENAWPFERVAWPGRDMTREEFDALPDKASGA
jgi:hypothetical protein